MVTISYIPFQHDDCMCAGLHAVLAAAKCASKGMGGVAIVIEDEVGMAVAFEPAGDPVALLREGGAHGALGAIAVIPRRGGGDVALALESFVEFGVAAPDVLAEGVPTSGLVVGKIVAFTDSSARWLRGCATLADRGTSARRRDDEEHECDRDPDRAACR